MKTLLVSLVSDQTIPNIQLIKEFKQTITDYFFISTSGIELKGARAWIERTCNIKESSVSKIEVNPFSFTDIETKLKQFDFDPFDKIIVNLTGGTKVMTLVSYDFFKNLAADIYYVTGNNDEFIKLYPIKRNHMFAFSTKVSLIEYLTAYGFKFKISSLSGISFEQTKTIFESFCKLNLTPFIEAIKYINSERAKTISEGDYEKVKGYLTAIKYQPINGNRLSAVETKYLSGDWFEEFIGLSIKKELNLNDDELFIGTTITKESPAKTINSVEQLLGEKIERSDNQYNNEMDVMFVYKNSFYSIECKSSIVAFKKIEKQGKIIDKPYNILGETIYKADSLKTRFGLYPKTSIVTLSNFKEYYDVKDRGQHNNKLKEMDELINRANISNIKLIDKALLCSSDSIFNLIK
jgi:hypothetical protein